MIIMHGILLLVDFHEHHVIWPKSKFRLNLSVNMFSCEKMCALLSLIFLLLKNFLIRLTQVGFTYFSFNIEVFLSLISLILGVLVVF